MPIVNSGLALKCKIFISKLKQISARNINNSDTTIDHLFLWNFITITKAVSNDTAQNSHSLVSQHSFYTRHTGQVKKKLKQILYSDNEDYNNKDDNNKNNDDDTSNNVVPQNAVTLSKYICLRNK